MAPKAMNVATNVPRALSLASAFVEGAAVLAVWAAALLAEDVAIGFLWREQFSGRGRSRQARHFVGPIALAALAPVALVVVAGWRLAAAASRGSRVGARRFWRRRARWRPRARWPWASPRGGTSRAGRRARPFVLALVRWAGPRRVAGAHRASPGSARSSRWPWRRWGGRGRRWLDGRRLRTAAALSGVSLRDAGALPAGGGARGARGRTRRAPRAGPGTAGDRGGRGGASSASARRASRAPPAPSSAQRICASCSSSTRPSWALR